MIPKKLLDEISRWMQEKKYGNLQINFSDGRIVNVNRVESVKVECLGSIDSATAHIVDNVIL
jgi:hypothetical protein